MALDNYVGARDIVDSIRIPNHFTIEALNNISERVTVLKSELQQLNAGINAVIVNTDHSAIEDNYWSLAELTAKIQAISATGTNISSQQYLLNLSDLSSTVAFNLDSTSTSTTFSYDRSSTSTLGFNKVDITFNVDTSTVISSAVSINIDNKNIDSFAVNTADDITTYSTQIKPEDSKLGIEQVDIKFRLESTNIKLTPGNISTSFKSTNSIGFNEVVVDPALEERTITVDDLKNKSDLVASENDLLGYSKIILPTILDDISIEGTLISSALSTSATDILFKEINAISTYSSVIVEKSAYSAYDSTSSQLIAVSDINISKPGLFEYTVNKDDLFYFNDSDLSTDVNKQKSSLQIVSTDTEYALRTITIPRILYKDTYNITSSDIDIALNAIASNTTEVSFSTNNFSIDLEKAALNIDLTNTQCVYKNIQIALPNVSRSKIEGQTFSNDISMLQLNHKGYIVTPADSGANGPLDTSLLSLKPTITIQQNGADKVNINPLCEFTSTNIIKTLSDFSVQQQEQTQVYYVNRQEDSQHLQFTVDFPFSATIKLSTKSNSVDNETIFTFTHSGEQLTPIPMKNTPTDEPYNYVFINSGHSQYIIELVLDYQNPAKNSLKITPIDANTQLPNTEAAISITSSSMLNNTEHPDYSKVNTLITQLNIKNLEVASELSSITNNLFYVLEVSRNAEAVSIDLPSTQATIKDIIVTTESNNGVVGSEEHSQQLNAFTHATYNSIANEYYNLTFSIESNPTIYPSVDNKNIYIYTGVANNIYSVPTNLALTDISYFITEGEGKYKWCLNDSTEVEAISSSLSSVTFLVTEQVTETIRNDGTEAEPDNISVIEKEFNSVIYYVPEIDTTIATNKITPTATPLPTE